MSISDISNGFGFLGGLGMFLYGMNIMADGMQKTAGSKMSSFLGMLTNNRFLAVALGALITAIIQSSRANHIPQYLPDNKYRISPLIDLSD